MKTDLQTYYPPQRQNDRRGGKNKGVSHTIRAEMQKGSEMHNESIGTGTTSPAVAGAAAPTDANKVTGDTALSPAEQGAAAMRAEFESLIKGKFKELYDERVGGAVKRRLRGMSAQVKR